MYEARPAAKVNLTLEVVGRRPDGYHELRSVFLRIGLADRLRIGPRVGADGDRLTVSGLPGVPVRGNLVLRAFDAIRAHSGLPLPALEAELEKAVPAAGGLGGGSSDCAAALALAQACWGVALAPADQLALGAALGSDVPFFVLGPPAALVEGRGEHVRPLSAPRGELGVLLVTPPIEVSTGAVFAHFDELNGARTGMAGAATAALAAALAAGLDGAGLATWAERLRDANELWPASASAAPQLPDAREVLESTTGRPWLLSGSGPTLFALYPSLASAVAAGEELIVDQPAELDEALINAVDLVGPDPAWRFP